MRYAGNVARVGEKRNAYRILVVKPEGKGPLVRSIHRWEDNIKICLKETGWGGMVLTVLAVDRDKWNALVNTLMNLRIP
jgi:hypothetical protein